MQHPDTGRPQNRLAKETSPYLLQHRFNPVDWYPWGKEAFHAAAERDVPVLLSVGYSACHWCHVMEHESFDNPEIAEIMNRHFVCIKVDREERPDIDHIYMESVQLMTGQGGWPMTVFLFPDGRPFYGGTYFPPTDRYGRPGFPRLLQSIASTWDQKRESLEEHADELSSYLSDASNTIPAAGSISAAILDKANERLKSQFDEHYGGFGGAPKFPQPMVLDYLIREFERTADPKCLEMTLHTLNNMCTGGIFDQIGGGFHRYSTDEYWLVPHFEKMLTDNALISDNLLNALRHCPHQGLQHLLNKCLRSTLDYILREMQHPNGGYFSAQDADSEGEEGQHFVWSNDEIKNVLGAEDFILYSRVYDVTPRGNWEGKNILNIAAPLENFTRSENISIQALDQRLSAMNQTLFEVRERRAKPLRDEKIITSWNGMTIKAMARASVILEEPRYVESAERAADFMIQQLIEDDQLLHVGCHDNDGFRKQRVHAFLEDYACLAEGLIELFIASNNARWLTQAGRLVDAAITLFEDKDFAFWSSEVTTELFTRPRDLTDNAVPSGNSTMLVVLQKLGTLTGRSDYFQITGRILERLVDSAIKHPTAFGKLLQAVQACIFPPVTVVVAGNLQSDDTSSLLQIARQQCCTNDIVLISDPKIKSTNEIPIFRDRKMIANQATAYVCVGETCLLPICTPEELSQALAGIRGQNE